MSAPDAPSIVLRDVARRLKQAGLDMAALEARLLVAHVVGCAPESLIGVEQIPLTAGQSYALDDVIARRINREPVAYITGTREFWSLPFKVKPGVLIPRGDSETVIASILEARPARDTALRVLDLGTGSGCLLLSLLSEYPAATGVGVDASDVALSIAAENAALLGLTARSRFLHWDWRQIDNNLYTNICALKFDVIVSNPPYIAEGDLAELMRDVVDYEPRLALAGGADGLDAYRQILPIIRGALQTGGMVVLECGVGQAREILKLAQGSGFANGRCAQDLAGIDRCVILGL